MPPVAVQTVSVLDPPSDAAPPPPPTQDALGSTRARRPPALPAQLLPTVAHDMTRGGKAPRAPNLRVAFAVVMYAASSLSGVFVNKACLSAFDFPHTIALLLAQLFVSVTALTILRALRIVVVPKRSMRELAVLLFPAGFLITNVLVGLLALRLVNIPMFSAFRRLSVLNVMVLEYFVLGKTATHRILGTVFIMVLGSFLAGLGDLTFDPVGYCLVFLNNFITAANLVSIKKASAQVRLEALSLYYYVSCIALPIVFLMALVTGDLRAAVATISARPNLQTPAFVLALSLSAGSAFLVNFFTNLCTQLTSPLTTAITGQMKNVLQTVLGIFAWGYRVSALNLCGLGVALVGSLLFAFYKYDDSRSSRTAPSTKEAAAAAALRQPAVVVHGGSMNPANAPVNGTGSLMKKSSSNNNGRGSPRAPLRSRPDYPASDMHVGATYADSTQESAALLRPSRSDSAGEVSDR